MFSWFNDEIFGHARKLRINLEKTQENIVLQNIFYALFVFWNEYTFVFEN